MLCDELVVERAWDLWQASPLICSMSVPMHVRPPENVNYLTKASKTRDLNRTVQYQWFGKMWESAKQEGDKSIKLQAPLAGDKVCSPLECGTCIVPVLGLHAACQPAVSAVCLRVILLMRWRHVQVAESLALLAMVDKFSNIRYGTGQSQAGVLPYIHFERNQELDVHSYHGYTLHCKFFLEGAQATMDVSDVRSPTACLCCTA